MYKKTISPTGNTVIILEGDGFQISFIDPSIGNADWQTYQDWIEAGNEPEIIDLTQ